jgi:hypothetical protein
VTWWIVSGLVVQAVNGYRVRVRGGNVLRILGNKLLDFGIEICLSRHGSSTG